jgi:lipopolysaccharide assembly outer membrane protein LptD (OstA)
VNARAPRLAPLVLLALLVATQRASAAAATAAADTMHAPATHARAAADTTHAPITHARAAADTTPQPPLNIAADNVTGSHGPEGDVVLLNGHVRIVRVRSVITAEHGKYARAQGLLDLTGNVKMVDSTTTLTCDQATFSEQDDILHVLGNVVITDRDAVLRAPRGTYDRKSGHIELNGGVTGHDKDQRLSCDTATYDRDSMIVHARGHVKGFDDPHKIELDAEAIDFNRRTREAIATGEPEMRSRDDRDRVTVLRGRLLHVNTETRIAEAVDSVVVSRDTLQASGERAVFDDVAGHGLLLGHPKLWDDETAVTGDSIEFWSEKRVLRRMRVLGHAVMDYQGMRPNTVGEASRLTGDQVEAFFKEDTIDSLVAIGGAHDQYQGQPLAGKTPERNLAKGDTIIVFFKDRKIDRARVLGLASGEYHPAVTVGDTLSARRETVQYDAPFIEFNVPRSRIVLDRTAHLTYSDLELRAKRVEYDVDGQTLTATGKPVLHEKGDEVTGHMMTYDLASRVGTIYKAETAYERGLYKGERIKKVGDNTLEVLNGSYSTCDLPEPHYHFASRYMKIYLKDKLVAKPVVFYVKHVPLFALPFYVFPIKPGRHSGFLFPQTEFGVGKSTGQFIRNAGYYWAPNDYFDLTLSGDYYQTDPSYILRAETQYKVQYLLGGDAAGTYAKNDALRREDWDFNAHHNQDLSPRTRLTASGEFISSRDYNTENFYGRALNQRLNRFLTSSLAISHAADWASFNAILDRRQDLDADVSIEDPDGTGPLPAAPPGTQATLSNLTESTPNLSVSFPTRTIGSFGPLKGTPFEKAFRSLYFSLSSRFLSQLDQRGYASKYSYFLRDTTLDSTTTVLQNVVVRRGFQTDASFSDSRRAFGWLNLQPRVSGSVAVFDHDELGNKIVPAGVWSGGVTSSATFYGTLNTRIGPLVGLRHVVVPSVTYNFSPEFTGLTYVDSLGQTVNRFQSFGSIGVSGIRTQSMSFNLDQRFQAKVLGKEGVRRLDNLLSWNIAGAYDFLYREHNAPHPLSPLGSSVLLQPPGLVNASMGFVTDVYSPRPMRSLTGNSSLTLNSSGARTTPTLTALPVDQTSRSRYDVVSPNFKDIWSASLAYSYSGGYATIEPKWSSQQTGNAVLHYQVSPGWMVDFSASYDITTRHLLTHRFALSRDLHCWTATFTRDFNPGSRAEYYFRISIKDQKEVYMEQGSRSASLGGIQ